MDEVYPIEVLHVVNPHIIYVEVRNAVNALIIEQIGIYGLIPVNQTIDIDGRVVAERCENWPAVATRAIIELLDGRVQTYFMPVQDECRSTIFNSNTIKFGNILLKTSKQFTSLKDQLEKLSLAEYNEALFHQKLSSGSLKLKLNVVRSEEVLKAIKNYYQQQNKDKKEWQEAIDRQTSLYQEGKKIANKLTAQNLKLLQKNEEAYNVLEIIDRKTKDLDLCKDVDEMSMGCGSRRQKTSKESTEFDTESPSTVLNQLKTFLSNKAKLKHNCDDFNDSAKASSGQNDTNHWNNQEYSNKSQNDDFWDEPYTTSKLDKTAKHKNIHIRKGIAENSVPSTGNDLRGESSFDRQSVKKYFDHEISDFDQLTQKIDRGKSPNFTSERKCGMNKSFDHQNDEFNKTSPKSIKSGKVKTHIMEPNKTPDRLVAYGPPSSFDISNLKIHKMNYDELSPYAPKTQEIHGDTDEIVSYKDDEENSDLVYDKKVENVDEKLIDNHQNDENKPTDIIVQSNSSQIAEMCTTAQVENFQNSTENSTRRQDQRLLRLLKRKKKVQTRDQSPNSDTSAKTSSKEMEDENIELIKEKLQSQYKPLKLDTITAKPVENIPENERNANPFKNLDGSKSVFVDKLVGPILMVHTKNDNLILPKENLRDVPFKIDIHIALKNMNIKNPNRLQSVSWSYIMRGHSVFLVGPATSGKSLGYIPAICNLVMDSNSNASSGPICVIVCATAVSVTSIEEHCKRFLGLDEVVLSCFAGVNMTEFNLALLNGCHVLIITAPMLYRLLGIDFGVDLRRLTTLVFEDAERLSEVYASEIKVILHHVKDMLKRRADNSWKVQYVVASRQWCDFMTPLAKTAPDSIIAIVAFQECVPYSKAPTSVQFVLKDNKVNAVLDFLKEIDSSKRMVIVCRKDDEVQALENTLKNSKHAIFTCNNTMTLDDLCNINVAWDKYEEPVLGPILICCDGNLTHMNVNNAHYLIHFSMSEKFSTFCKRFAVLNENYASIFKSQNQIVKIKILLEESNSEQLPKILKFLKRCTNEAFPMLTDISKQVLDKKNLKKAEEFVPICNSLMTLGECAEVWNCGERHAILKDYDEPKPWMPQEGLINFKITFFSSAVTYSARLLSNVTKSDTIKYPNNYNTLLLKMGMYYSKEVNRKTHGIVKLGDICAVAVKPIFFERCQVIKILHYSKGRPHIVLVNLIDEERLEITKDVHLYHLPEEFKAIETHVVKVRLAYLQPQDKDFTFSALARNELKKITENDENLYMRGEVVLAIGNCIFVDSLEACQDLSSLGETVVKYDFKKELLSRHAEENPEHIPKLQKLGAVVVNTEKVKVPAPEKVVKRPKWAHLDKDDFSTVILTSAENAGEFFVRLEKFQKVIDSLVNDIQKILETLEELPQNEVYVGNIVLAQFPDDQTYERARIDSVINEEKVKCFFVDNGDWREVSVKYLRPMPDNILNRVPFQAIECHLIGVKPPSDEWTEFGTNWFWDNCAEDSNGKTKYLFAKYFTKEQATITGGHKYGVILIDTSTESDVMINKQLIELNLARENESEVEFLNRPLDMKSLRITDSSDDDDFRTNTQKETVKDLAPLLPVQKLESPKENNTLRQILFEKPLKSVPLVNDSDDCDSEISVNFNNGELMKMFKTRSFPAADVNNELVINENMSMKAITAAPEAQNRSDVSKTDSTRTLCTTDLTDSDDFVINKDRNLSSATLKSLLRKKGLNISESTNSQSKTEYDSDDFSSTTSSLQNNDKLKDKIHSKIIDVTDPPRKPKLIWRQNKSSVSVKIQLIGVENYNLDIKEKSIKFCAYHNDTNYEFEFDLYGVVNVKKCRHSSKGQYILVVMPKLMQRNWFNLAKECSHKNWISYDVDAVDMSSDEEVGPNDDELKVLKKNFEQDDSESDDDFVDDAEFTYRK